MQYKRPHNNRVRNDDTHRANAGFKNLFRCFFLYEIN